MSFNRAVSVTELSWFWIVLQAIVPPAVALLIAWPCWMKSQPILGNLAGSAVIFAAALLLIIRESIEIDRPVSMVYSQWTRFETFPEFMDGVTLRHLISGQPLGIEQIKQNPFLCVVGAG